MVNLPRVLYGAGALALVIFVLVINGTVHRLQTTMQSHSTILDKPVLDVAVFPGVPAAFTERWHKATPSASLQQQDHLWLTLALSNVGASQARGLSAEFVLLPALSAPFSGSEALSGNPAITVESTGQTRATFAFLSLAPGNTHVVFLAVRPEGIAGPPYTVSEQRQWVAQSRAYWEHFTVTVEKHTPFVQYGFAPPLLTRQAAHTPADVSTPAAVLQRAALRMP